MIKFFLSAFITIWMLIDAYKWMRRDWREFEPKIVFKGFVLALILLFYDQVFPITNEVNRLTVFVRNEKEEIPVDLLYKAVITAFCNHKTDNKLIGENGEIDFDIISPPKNDTIEFTLSQADDYELIENRKPYTGDPIKLYIRSKCNFCTIRGLVQSQKEFIKNAVVTIEGKSDTTDSDGNFDITLPLEMEQKEYMVVVRFNNKIIWQHPVTPEPNRRFSILVN